MIIWGSKGVENVIKRGKFMCPMCECQRRYEFTRLDKYFTLYFVPLFSMEKICEYVKCLGCKETFKTSVLDETSNNSKEGFIALYQEAMLRVMVAMMLADGQIDEEEKNTVKSVFGGVSGNDLTDSQLRKEITRSTSEKLDLTKYLTNLGPALSESGKENLVKAALLVAYADGEFSGEEQTKIAEVSVLLGISPTHYQGILASLDSDEDISDEILSEETVKVGAGISDAGGEYKNQYRCPACDSAGVKFSPVLGRKGVKKSICKGCGEEWITN